MYTVQKPLLYVTIQSDCAFEMYTCFYMKCELLYLFCDAVFSLCSVCTCAISKLHYFGVQMGSPAWKKHFMNE